MRPCLLRRVLISPISRRFSPPRVALGARACAAPLPPALLPAAFLLAALAVACASPSASTASPDADDVFVADDAASLTDAGNLLNPLQLRPLHVAADRRIVDDFDREVLLRGTNVTSLGEYWQGDADHKPTQELTAQDWSEMAAQGFSVIRLVVHWSLLEPVRGSLDTAYLDRIDAYVQAAAAHGIYTVIDMHQDAYTAFIHTELSSDCTGDTAPAKGWDGAPDWAVYTDGLSTCVTGDRNSSPAVTAAWNHFYDNTAGIRDRFVATWAGLAARFAGRPEIAGYDLLNEPEVSRPATELGPLYNQLVKDCVLAIRDAEKSAKFAHIIVVEPAFAAGHPQFGLVVPDPASVGLDVVNVVAGPHNYAEAIGNGLPLSIEDMSGLYVNSAEQIGVPAWIGEHGFWSTDAETLAKLDRYVADEDARVLGGAWWQWRQPCGDPHSVPWGGYAGGQTNQQIHLHGVACPGDKDLGATEPLLRVLRRAAPRFAPGRIQKLASDWKSGAFELHATGATPGAELVVWVPLAPGSQVQAELTGLQKDAKFLSVTGGAWLVATVIQPEYRVKW